MIDVAGVRKTYPGRGAPLLDGIDLRVGAGETVGLIGPGASGKSVLLKLLCGLERTDAGHVRVFGEDLGLSDEDSQAPTDESAADEQQDETAEE